MSGKMKTADLKNEVTLAAVAEKPTDNHHYLVFALVVDITEPLKFEAGSNYVTQLKVIDPSFNYRVKSNNKELRFFKFCHINIYTESPAAAPPIKWVGEVLRLRRFKYKISDRGELQGFEQVQYSNWIVYSGRRGEDMRPLSYKQDYAKNLNREMTAYEQGRIADLREWAIEFFSGSSLRYIIWWNDLNKKIDARTAATDCKEVDLILKVGSVNAKKDGLMLTDCEQRKYTLNMPSAMIVKPGVVIKLRCVNVRFPAQKDGVGVITYNERTSCLLVPEGFRDALAFTADKQKIVGKKLYLVEFNCDKKNAFVTDIKRIHNGLKVTPAAALLAMLERDAALHQSERFVFEGRVAGFASTDPSQIICKQTEKFEPTVPLSTDLKKKYQIIYHVAMHLQDSSSKDRLTAYLTTSADSYYVFDAWNLLPPTKDNESWNKMKPAQLAKFTAKLESLAAKSLKVRFVLQLLLTESRKPFFKIIDTLFLDF